MTTEVEDDAGVLTLREAADHLGVHYMTAYRYVRTGLLRASKSGSTWQVAVPDLTRFQHEDDARGVGRRTRSGYVERLVDRLAVGDEAGASALVDQSLAGGADVEEVYLELVVPALRVIGDRWEQGTLTVAAEHQASAIVLRLLGRVGTRFLPRGTKRGTVVVGAVPGDLHGLPCAIVADLLRLRRFDVIDLGGDVPAAGFVDACRDRDRLLVVAVCATVKRDRAVRDVVRALRAGAIDAPIVVGGASVGDVGHARALGGDAWGGSTGADVEEAVEALLREVAPA